MTGRNWTYACQAPTAQVKEGSTSDRRALGRASWPGGLPIKAERAPTPRGLSPLAVWPKCRKASHSRRWRALPPAAKGRVLWAHVPSSELSAAPHP
jgi:hypothetical protein